MGVSSVVILAADTLQHRKGRRRPTTSEGRIRKRKEEAVNSIGLDRLGGG